MESSDTPLFRLEMTGSNGTVFTPMKWPVDGVVHNPDGEPIWDELAEFVKAFEESLKPGGDHHQMGIDSVSDARIVRQSDGEIIVHWNRRVGF